MKQSIWRRLFHKHDKVAVKKVVTGSRQVGLHKLNNYLVTGYCRKCGTNLYWVEVSK